MHYQTLPGGTSAFLTLSSDCNVLSSTVIALNNFFRNSHCQVVQLFLLTSFLTKAFTTIITKHSLLVRCVFRQRFVPLIYQNDPFTIRGVTRGERGTKFPGCRVIMGVPNHCGVRRIAGVRQKVPTMSQALSLIQCICFRKTSGSNMGVPNVLLAPGAI